MPSHSARLRIRARLLGLALCTLVPPAATIQAQEEAPPNDAPARPIDAQLANIAHRIQWIAETMEDSEERAEALSRAAEVLVWAGDREAARKTWERAVNAATEAPASRPSSSPAMLEIGSAQVRQGERESAHATLARACEIALSMPDDHRYKVSTLANVLLQQQSAGDDAAARLTLDRASTFIETTRAPSVRDNRRKLRAFLLATVADYQGILRLVVEPEPDGRPIPEQTQFDLLMTLAGCARSDPRPDLGAALQESLPLVRGLENPSLREHVLLYDVQAEARLDRIEEATQIMESLHILDALREIPDRRMYQNRLILTVETLIEIAQALTRADRPDEARSVLVAAVSLAETLPNGLLLTKLALAQAAAGDLDAARKTITKLPQYQIGQGLLSLARERRKAGDAEGARIVLKDMRRDAEARLRDQPSDQARLDLATALTGLGDLEAAERLARELPEGSLRISAFARIAQAQAEAGDLEPIFQLSEELETPRARAVSLYFLARELSSRAASSRKPEPASR